jgi:hypothetical protein
MIIRILVLITSISIFSFTTVCAAEEVTDITWQMLVPKLPAQEDPFAGLSAEAIEHVEWIIYLRMFLPAEIAPEYEELYDEVNRALPELAKAGIDIDEIIADRRYRSSALNSELDGKLVRLPGYLLPLDLSGNAVTDFLLVPYVGACIHVPPPPPNQILYAVSAAPVPYEIDKLFAPVSVIGRIQTKALSKELFLVDGSSDIDIGYHMTVDKIEKYKP